MRRLIESGAECIAFNPDSAVPEPQDHSDDALFIFLHGSSMLHATVLGTFEIVAEPGGSVVSGGYLSMVFARLRPQIATSSCVSNDFMFRLTDEESESLRSQNVTSTRGRRRYLPLAFTEHGAIMAASVLNSDRAVEMGVYVVRAFVQLRAVLLDHKALADKLAALERRVSHHDNSLADVINAIRALMAQPKPANRPIGFTADVTGTPAKR